MSDADVTNHPQDAPSAAGGMAPSSAPGSEGDGMSRRGFLQACTAGAALTVVAAGGYVAFRFLQPDGSLDVPADFVLGRAQDIPQGRTFVAQAKLFVERQGARVRCISAVCTHLGCLVTWDEGIQRYRCPCHGSDFLPDGTNPTGPASKPLPFFRLSRDADGRVIAHRRQTLVCDGNEWLDLG
ncbi:MAG: Rieske 2Fe-2S domain-containing protein [Phycisphaerae bacterium]|nr:Rieske 2Fe-2S domain-containing protein [Phycisphaerae bacterium]